MMDIDFVILWVDGSDPKWLEEKVQYQTKELGESDTVNRYRDWELLPFWFRAIEYFTPWVRRIHFVTWGHLPKFLNTENPKLHIVNHKDFIPSEYLPTFSSHAIEMNIHRIPGLADHFVYFNDDMFVLDNLKPEDFFRDGLPCTVGSEVPFELYGEIGVWQHAMINNIGVVNKQFSKKISVKKYSNKYRNSTYRWQDNIRTLALEKLYPDYFVGFKNIHGPAAYLKSSFEEVWSSEPELLHRTSMHRFRNCEDVNQWVVLWWQIASGQFSPGTVDNYVIGIDNSNIANICDCIENQRHKMICINDPSSAVDFQYLDTQLKDSFQKLLPEKSSFER